jgi:hypothetical protein
MSTNTKRSSNLICCNYMNVSLKLQDKREKRKQRWRTTNLNECVSNKDGEQQT